MAANYFYFIHKIVQSLSFMRHLQCPFACDVKDIVNYGHLSQVHREY
jgi:hypothetical protein